MNMFIFLFAHRDWSYVLTQLTSFLSNTLSPLEGLNTPLAAILAQNHPEMYFISLVRNMDKLFGFVLFVFSRWSPELWYITKAAVHCQNKKDPELFS